MIILSSQKTYQIASGIGFKKESKIDSDYIEMIEEFDGYAQVVCIFEADFGVSLFVNNKVIKTYELKELLNVS